MKVNESVNIQTFVYSVYMFFHLFLSKVSLVHRGRECLTLSEYFFPFIPFLNFLWFMVVRFRLRSPTGSGEALDFHESKS
jgi:hypothetical protein